MTKGLDDDVAPPVTADELRAGFLGLCGTGEEAEDLEWTGPYVLEGSGGGGSWDMRCQNMRLLAAVGSSPGGVSGSG